MTRAGKYASRITFPCIMRRLLGLLLPGLLVAGCDLVQRPPLDDGFGAPYRILLGVPSAQTRMATPVLSDEELLVVVEYTGGCNDHLFRLDYTTMESEAQVRIVHDAFGDTCEALIRKELSLTVSEAALSQPRVTLLGPTGGVIQLKPSTEQPVVVQP